MLRSPPAALALRAALAKTTAGLLYNNFAGIGTGLFNSNQWTVRGDYALNEKMHAFARSSRFTDTLRTCPKNQQGRIRRFVQGYFPPIASGKWLTFLQKIMCPRRTM